MAEPSLVTAADIARLAGVTRGTVSNWRRRHHDFPVPVGGTDASPAYDRAEVEAWLAARDALPELPLDERIWRALVARAEDGDLVRAVRERSAELNLLAAIGDGIERGQGVPEGAGISPAEELDILVDRYVNAVGIADTPRPVADLMAELADVSGGSVFDPCCGAGTLLSAAIDGGALRLAGQDVDRGLAELAGARLTSRFQPITLHPDDEDFEPPVRIAALDSLRQDYFAGDLADVVLCHPPFGDRDWGHEELAGDPRWVYGIPPKSEPELAWVQLALSHLKPGGRAVLLLPPAVASRPSARRIRAELVRRGALRAIIALPAGLVRPVHVPVHLWVLGTPAGTTSIDPRLLFVDVTGRHWSDQGQDSADGLEAPGSGAVAASVLAAWRAFAGDDKEPQTNPAPALPGEPGTWQVVRAIDLLDDAVDLAPSSHVAPARLGRSPQQTLDEARILRDQVRAALSSVGDVLPAGQWPVNRTPSSWPTSSLAELARRGLLEYVRGGQPSAEDITLRTGDVVIPVTAAAATRTIVTTEADEGAPLEPRMHLIRPDTGQLDPWFLAGFLTTPASIARTSSGTSALRLLNPRTLTVPLLPMAEQRRYGAAFRALHDLEDAASRVGRCAEDLAQLLAGALAEGTLLPPDAVETQDHAAHSLTGGSNYDLE